ncbi:Carboxylesterase [Nesidiocoris tenuis]|uniref:Carboxylic ester hydrolase n=1 Tax=Nesidiocoris tenuis TaxID=355587 RepID=A0ABN7B5L7_9HEMI|nr:Carboxylesterase [Nesidiocoris tenuis]
MLFIAIFGVCCAIIFPAISAGPIVETPLGKYEGWERLSRSGRVYQAWTGIPFAQPPVGKLRFKAPLPIGKHEGVMNATREDIQCVLPSGDGNEDCLMLKVFRPKQTNEELLPVLVWVHGGAFMAGNPGAKEVADFIMDEDVILVAITYRLNGFGFLSFGDKVLPGNFGLKDQAMALAWVKENIASFGGNPESITVYGESAGAASSHYLLKSPLTEHIVSRAVSDSGTINHVWSIKDSTVAKNISLQVAASLNCLGETSEETLRCLQEDRSAGDLAKAFAAISSPDLVTPQFTPVIEPEDAEGAFATEDLSVKPSNKPWITSCTNGEFVLFWFTLQRVPKDVLAMYEQNIVNELADLVSSHNNDTTHLSEYVQILYDVYFNNSEDFSIKYSKMFMDSSFVFGALANLLKHQGPKWMLHFEYKGNLSRSPFPVAGHAEEAQYYFSRGGHKMTPEDLAVSKRLIKYLVNFAKYGDPTPPGSAFEWPQFRTHEMLRMTADGDIISDEAFYIPFEDKVNIWDYTIGWK